MHFDFVMNNNLDLEAYYESSGISMMERFC